MLAAHVNARIVRNDYLQLRNFCVKNYDNAILELDDFQLIGRRIYDALFSSVLDDILLLTPIFESDSPNKI